MNDSTPLSHLSSSPSPSIPPTALGTPTFSTHAHLPAIPTSASLHHATQTLDVALRVLEQSGEDDNERVSEYVGSSKTQNNADGTLKESSPSSSSIDLNSSYSFSKRSSKSRKPSPPPLDLSLIRPTTVNMALHDVHTPIHEKVKPGVRKVIPKSLGDGVKIMKGMKVVLGHVTEKEREKTHGVFGAKDVNRNGFNTGAKRAEGMITGRWRRTSDVASNVGTGSSVDKKQHDTSSKYTHHDLAPLPWLPVSPPSKPSSSLRPNAPPYTASIGQAILPISKRFPASPSALMTPMRSAPAFTTSFTGTDGKGITFDPFSSPLLPPKSIEPFSLPSPPASSSSNTRNPLGWTDDSLLLDFEGRSSLGSGKCSGNAQVVIKEPLEAGQCEIGSSRSIIIGGIPKSIDRMTLKKKIQEVAPFRAMIVKHLQEHGSIIIIFFDPRSTAALVRAIQDGRLVFHDNVVSSGKIEIQGLADEKVLQLVGEPIKKVLATNVSDVFLTMNPARPLLNRSEIMDTLAAFGEVQSLQPCSPDQSTFIASFYDSRDAAKASAGLDLNYVHNTHLEVTIFCPSYLQTVTDGPSSSHGVPTVRATGLNTFASNSSLSEQVQASRFPQSNAQTDHQTSHRPGYYQDSAPSTPLKSSSFQDRVIPQTPERMTSHLGPQVSPASPLTLEQVRRERKRLEDLETLLLSTPKPNQHFERYYPSRATEPPTPTRPRSTSVPSTPYGGNSDLFGDSSEIYQSRINRLGNGSHNSGNMFPKMGSRSPSIQSSKHYKEALYNEMVPKANRLSLELLRQGRDTRTTVMVKDIPNKLTRQELIEVFEEVVPGEIDFMSFVAKYLEIIDPISVL